VRDPLRCGQEVWACAGWRWWQSLSALLLACGGGPHRERPGKRSGGASSDRDGKSGSSGAYRGLAGRLSAVPPSCSTSWGPNQGSALTALGRQTSWRGHRFGLVTSPRSLRDHDRPMHRRVDRAVVGEVARLCEGEREHRSRRHGMVERAAVGGHGVRDALLLVGPGDLLADLCSVVPR
jgi:hypothetical protein